jgi:hypothetical protein
MTSTMTIDRHRYITTLRSAGMDEKLATAHAQGLADALQETVATKADLNALQLHLDTKFAAIDAKFAATEAKFNAIDTKFDANTDKFDAKLGSLQSHLDVKFADLSSTLTKQASDNQRLLIGIIVAIVLAGVTVASIITRPTVPAVISVPVKP